MQLRILGAFAFLALAGNVAALPVAEPAPSLVVLDARAVTVHPTFAGDLKSIAIPELTAADRKDAKTLKKAQAKIAKKTAQQKVIAGRQQAALARVETAINAASSALKLSGSLNVDIINDFHTSRSDEDSHATFKFKAPICAPECTGHAYNPKAKDGQVARIFSAAHNSIFGGEPRKGIL